MAVWAWNMWILGGEGIIILDECVSPHPSVGVFARDHEAAEHMFAFHLLRPGPASWLTSILHLGNMCRKIIMCRAHRMDRLLLPVRGGWGRLAADLWPIYMSDVLSLFSCLSCVALAFFFLSSVSYSTCSFCHRFFLFFSSFMKEAKTRIAPKIAGMLWLKWWLLLLVTDENTLLFLPKTYTHTHTHTQTHKQISMTTL